MWSTPAKAQDAEGLKANARALYKQGDYAQAITVFERALEAATRAYGASNQKTDIVANELAMSYYNQARHQDAEVLFNRVLQNHETRLGPNNTEVATCLNNLGSLYDSMGDYVRAEAMYVRSQQILTAALGADHPDMATTYNNLGAVSRNLGDSAKAVGFYLKSRQLYEKQRPRNETLIANVTNNLANAYSSLGQYDLAEPLFRQALQSREGRLGPSHPSVATTLNSLASLLEDQKRYDQVEELYQRALSIRQEKLGADHPAVATTLNNLASLYRKQARYDEAEKPQAQSLKIRQEKLGVDHPLVAHSLHNLAGIYTDLGQNEKALAAYQQSLKILQEKHGSEHPEIALSYNNFGFLYARLDQWAESADAFDRCRRIVRQHVSQVLPSMSETEQLTFLQTTDEHFLHGALAMGFEQRNNPAIAERSASWLLNAKGIAQQAMAQKRTLDRDLKDPEIAPEVRRLQEIRRELSKLLQAAIKPEDVDRVQQINQLREQEKAAAARLAEKSGRPVQSTQWAEIADVRKALQPKSVLIEIARFRPRNFKALSADKDRWLPTRYAAWIIPPAGEGNVTIIDLGEASIIDQAVADARKALVASGEMIKSEGEVAAEASLIESLAPLTSLIVKPWLEHAQQAERWIISPDAVLWVVPWSALPLAGKRYAIEKVQIDYVVSGRDLLAQKNERATLGAPIVFADPDYDLSFKDLLVSIRPLFPPNQVPRPYNIVRPLVNLGSVPRLPATAMEAQAILPKLQAYSGLAPQNFMGEHAQETVLKAIQRPKALVVSTHGFFLPDRDEADLNSSSDETASGVRTTKKRENPLLRCGLMMAGCNSRDLVTRIDTDDGVLTGQEILDADLRDTELVVLSACQTGLGEVRNGEGVAGLRQAFQLAGARTVMATLWEVPDVQTARLMIKFFGYLAEGKSKGAALRESQREAIQARRDRYGAAHPFFWAAFTLTGAP